MPQALSRSIDHHFGAPRNDHQDPDQARRAEANYPGRPGNSTHGDPPGVYRSLALAVRRVADCLLGALLIGRLKDRAMQAQQAFRIADGA